MAFGVRLTSVACATPRIGVTARASRLPEAKNRGLAHEPVAGQYDEEQRRSQRVRAPASRRTQHGSGVRGARHRLPPWTIPRVLRAELQFGLQCMADERSTRLRVEVFNDAVARLRERG
jgi:hypothetical protein